MAQRRESAADLRARIDALRGRIDALDATLVTLLNERAGCALEIGQEELAVKKPPAEATTGASECDPARFPMSGVPPLACCADGDDEWLIPGGATTVGLGHRRRGNACTLADGVTGGCVGRACFFGPCGARVIESFAAAPPGRAPRSAVLDTLTARERDVLALLARGRSNAEIAADLYLGEATVKTHVSSVLMKLGLRDRVQAVVAAYETGLVTPGSA